MSTEELKASLRSISSNYRDKELRARRLFIEERAAALHKEREREFEIKTDISSFFDIPYASVAFCGSAQLGMSIHKDKLFEPAISDLDGACVNVDLFQRAWIDVITSTRAFTDDTAFGRESTARITQFKEQLLRRGMIRVETMPRSDLSLKWSTYQGELSRRHNRLFRKITLTIYMNEYAFCWKQNSIIDKLTG